MGLYTYYKRLRRRKEKKFIRKGCTGRKNGWNVSAQILVDHLRNMNRLKTVLKTFNAFYRHFNCFEINGYSGISS